MILITGATGNVGREAVKQLVDEGAQVGAATRDPVAAALPDAAHVISADASYPGTLEAALDGVEAILLSPRAVDRASAELLSLAGRHGVKRVVVLLAALAWAGQIRSTGVVRGAYPHAATSTIHERDIAAVAAKALTDPAHAGQTYVLTGPQSLTQVDKVRIVGRAIGRELSFLELPADQVRRGMLAAGLPEEIPDRLLGSLADYARQAGPSTDTVERILGRPALTYAGWAAEHAAAFRN